MTLSNCLVLSAILFCVGIYGLLTRRNLIGMLLSIEIILNASIINFVSFAHFGSKDPTAGSVISVFVIAIAACEMAVALAIVVSMYRQHRDLDIGELRQLNG